MTAGLPVRTDHRGVRLRLARTVPADKPPLEVVSATEKPGLRVSSVNVFDGLAANRPTFFRCVRDVDPVLQGLGTAPHWADFVRRLTFNLTLR